MLLRVNGYNGRWVKCRFILNHRKINEIFIDGTFVERGFYYGGVYQSILDVYAEALYRPGYYKKLEKYTFKDVELEAIEFDLPDFDTYYEGVKEFLKSSKAWYSLNNHFYTVGKNGYKESCDNAQGGIDVSWAFYRKRKGESVNKPTIKKVYKQLVRDHVDALLENLE